MADALQHIEEVKNRAMTELAAVKSPAELEQFRIKYLGSKGEVKNLTDLIAQAPKEQKRDVGQKANAARTEVGDAFKAKEADIKAGAGAEPAMIEDVTEPGKRPQIGNRHILMTVVDELTELFGRMGFAVAT